MSRPFMLYHWSPIERRASITRYGLCPNKKSLNGQWRPPYVCYCRSPSVAWALSATHSGKPGAWDLWATWSDSADDYTTLNTAKNPRAAWWQTEYRIFQRIPKSKLWHVGTRMFNPCTSAQSC